jgi:hypothetical protein
MNCWRLAIATIAVFPILCYAANPFLDAPNDQPVSAKFRGTEWSEDNGERDIPLTARAVTTRIAKMQWGEVFKIVFIDLKSGAEKQREVRPEYFVVTQNRIVLLNEEDNDAATRKISAMDKPPEFEPNDIYGITSGSFEHQEREWKMTIKLKGDLCVYEASSGHFKKVMWKKGVGLVEYASGYGAHADGYRLKRVTNR